MCGRFSLNASQKQIEQEMGITLDGELRQRFNISPTQRVLALTADGGGRRVPNDYEWWFTPEGATKRSKYTTFNARVDKILDVDKHKRSMFRKAFQTSRCLILATGFIEWKYDERGQDKQPYYVYLPDRPVYGFAGVYSIWEAEDGPRRSCTILTTDNNAFMGNIHDRMPVILPSSQIDDWLRPGKRELEDLAPFMAQYDSDKMAAYACHPDVGKSSLDQPYLIEQIPAEDIVVPLLS